MRGESEGGTSWFKRKSVLRLFRIACRSLLSASSSHFSNNKTSRDTAYATPRYDMAMTASSSRGKQKTATKNIPAFLNKLFAWVMAYSVTVALCSP